MIFELFFAFSKSSSQCRGGQYGPCPPPSKLSTKFEMFWRSLVFCICLHLFQVLFRWSILLCSHEDNFVRGNNKVNKWIMTILGKHFSSFSKLITSYTWKYSVMKEPSSVLWSHLRTHRYNGAKWKLSLHYEITSRQILLHTSCCYLSVKIWHLCILPHLMLSFRLYSSLVCSPPPSNTLMTADWTLQTKSSKSVSGTQTCFRYVFSTGEF